MNRNHFFEDVMINIAINGVSGRMGRMILSLVQDAADIAVVAGVEHAGHPELGADLGSLIGKKDLGTAVTETINVPVDVVIDFSLPQGTMATLARCCADKTSLVIGTTGFDAKQIAEIGRAAGEIAVVFSPNMSVGVNVLFALVRRAAGVLGADYDAEIVETHHRFKADAPSGTAANLVKMIAEGRGEATPDVVYGRHGNPCKRKPGEIGVHAVRSGDTVGDHRVFFSALGETVEIAHRANTREGFARGALLAARFVVGKKPGLYTMHDVLGLDD